MFTLFISSKVLLVHCRHIVVYAITKIRTTKQRFYTHLNVPRKHVINFCPAVCYATTMRLLRVFIVLFSVFSGNSSKSIFVQPTFRPNCPHGFVLDRSGMCVEIIEIDRDDYEVFLIAKISSVDYEDDSEPEAPQSDQPSDAENYVSNHHPPNADMPDAPPTIFQENSVPEVLEEIGNFSNEFVSPNSKDKRSTSPLNDLTLEEISSQRSVNENSEFPSNTTPQDIPGIAPENVTQQIDVNVNNEIGNFSVDETGYLKRTDLHRLSNNFLDEISENEEGKIISVSPNNEISLKHSKNLIEKEHNDSDTASKFSINLLLKNKVLKKSMNIATEISLIHKRKANNKNGGILVPSKKFVVTFLNSQNKTMSSEIGNKSQIIEKHTENFGRSTKLRHSQKWKHQNLYGVLKKVFGGRRHKSKS